MSLLSKCVGDGSLHVIVSAQTARCVVVSPSFLVVEPCAILQNWIIKRGNWPPGQKHSEEMKSARHWK